MTDLGVRPPPPNAAQGLAGGVWRIAAASVQGPAHAARGEARQDAFAVGILPDCGIVVVCDGAGSATRAADGANGFAAAVRARLLQAASAGGLATCQHFRAVVIEGVEAHRALLEAEGSILHDHHATLIVIAASRDRTLVAHVGDGLAAVAAEGDWPQATLSHPENGEFANETFFVTEADWTEHLRCVEMAGLRAGGAAVALTDGAMPFVVGIGGAGLEPDFMAPVSRFLLSEDIGLGSQGLAGLLDGIDARRISSDDKTLVWISGSGG